MEEFINKIIHGDSLEVLKELPDNSVDSIVTDPPYELGFMGKSWDNTGIANNPLMWAECLRVLKPGGHLLAFSGTRTYHRMAVAIEDAGFEVRDMVEWVYGSGFPKSFNIAKALEARELTGSMNKTEFKNLDGEKSTTKKGFRPNDYTGRETTINHKIHTEVAKQWEGWGTALKPAHEPICMARKPIEGTVAENCLKYGTGGINIDESRVEYTGQTDPRTFGGKWKTDKAAQNVYEGGYEGTDQTVSAQGRFPANLIHDNSEEVRECFPETKSGGGNKGNVKDGTGMFGSGKAFDTPIVEADSGNASRFFKSIIYQAKASKSERNKGCEGLEEKPSQLNSGGISRECSVEKRLEENGENAPTMKNNHPTVKPIALMEYLIKMVTPKGGVVLDPFAGSCSTIVAAKENGFKYIGIEKEEEYTKICHARLASIPNSLF